MSTARGNHLGVPGTRACWAEGCIQYECVTAVDIDPVRVKRHLAGEPVGGMLTLDEREEALRQRGRNARAERVAERRPHLPQGRLHYGRG